MAAPLAAILPFILVGAILYTSVGHGGATIYLAILTLAGFAVGPLSTTILVLNIVAAGIGFFMFRHAGHLRWRLLLPFLAASVPMAFIGGLVPFSGRAQDLVLGFALLLAAARFLFLGTAPNLNLPQTGPAYYIGAPLAGAAMGFLAGVTGIGGGIFLSPLLLVLGWASIKETASISAAFIVVNSMAGLAAKFQRVPPDVGLVLPMGAVVVLGALVGSFLGARRLPPRGMQIMLGIVLLLAGAKALLV